MDELIWTPSKRQTDFLALPDSIFEALYGGAAGGGKSEALLMLPITRQFYQHSSFKALLLRRTYPELERELILRSHRFYPSAGGSYHEEKKRWKFPSGAIIQFGYAEYEKDVRRYDTSEYNYIGFDELTSFTEFQYKYLAMSRCRSSSQDLPAIVRAGTNPGNVGHGWVRTRFIEDRSGKPIPANTILQDRETGLKRIFIPAKLSDNPYLTSADPDYENRLKSLPEAERRAKLDGDWYTFSGQVFSEWREQPFPDEPSNARHVIPYSPIPAWYPRLLAIDWGFTAMTYALFGALAPRKRLILYKEYAIKNAKISTWATDIGRIAQQDVDDGAVFCDVVLDPSAWQNRGEAQLIAQQFQTYSGLIPRRADNDRIGGKLLLQEYLRWMMRPSRRLASSELFDANESQSILRRLGPAAHKKYCDSFRDEREAAALPRLQVMENCTEFRKVIPLCVYSDNNVEDVAGFNGDDPYDTARYIVAAAERSTTSSAIVDRAEKIESAVASLEQNSDMTSYYRRMEHIERAARLNRPHPVRRFHAARP